MKKYIASLFVAGSLLFASCSNTEQIGNFDSKRWKSDKYACEGDRKQMQADFEEIRKQLYGREEKDIRALLGSPDGEELMSRGQRMFYYYLEPGMQCTQKGKISEANKAEVRFNATYKVSEITYTRPLVLQ